jgi:C4-dicarboxylate-specific signal transduction histidine kinase
MSAKVLIVDDEEGNLIVCEAVCGETFELLTAHDAEHALELMRQHEVGVVVADQRMPGMSGVELLERIRIDYPDTVRLLMTAYTDMPAAIDSINRGQVRRYLKKPWKPEELKAELQEALDWYHATRRLHELEQRLIQTERVYALGIVAAGIGHELRNPIGWISTNLSHSMAELGEVIDLLAKQPGYDRLISIKVEEVSASLTDASTGVQRVQEIVSGIELSTVKPTGEPEVVPLADVLRLSLRLVGGPLKRSARLELDIEGSPRVRGSSTQLSQIVLNLLVNAFQAVADQPSNRRIVNARIKSDGRFAELEVADAGPGVAESDAERIFHPFFTTKPGVGSGLGLAISRRIAEELGGRLEVSRDEKLGGACFRLSLALEQPGS